MRFPIDNAPRSPVRNPIIVSNQGSRLAIDEASSPGGLRPDPVRPGPICEAVSGGSAEIAGSVLNPPSDHIALENVVICKTCGFSGFRVRNLVHHLIQHNSMTLICGVDGCIKQYYNLRSFKSHLSKKHPYFYPDLQGEVPDFRNSSVFALRGDVAPVVNVELAHSNEDVSFDFDPASPQPHFFNNEFSDSVAIDSATKDFLEILVRKGCNSNIPFKTIQEISSAFISFFNQLSSNNLLSEDLIHSLYNSVSSSDRFDTCLERYFNASFPEIIQIQDSEDNFVVFDFKKALEHLVSQHNSFSEILLSETVRSETITSFPPIINL